MREQGLPSCATDGETLLSVDWLALVARRIRALGNPTRLQLLLLLEDRPSGVEELASCFGMSHQRISKHLNVLLSAGVLSRVQNGSRGVYSIADFTALQMARIATESTVGFVEEFAELLPEPLA